MPGEIERTGTTESEGIKLFGVRIPDDLFRRFKAQAALEGRQLQELTEDALAQYLRKVEKKAARG